MTTTDVTRIAENLLIEIDFVHADLYYIEDDVESMRHLYEEPDPHVAEAEEQATLIRERLVQPLGNHYLYWARRYVQEMRESNAPDLYVKPLLDLDSTVLETVRSVDLIYAARLFGQRIIEHKQRVDEGCQTIIDHLAAIRATDNDLADNH